MNEQINRNGAEVTGPNRTTSRHHAGRTARCTLAAALIAMTVGVVGMAPLAAAAPVPTSFAKPPPPQYSVRAISFTAADESDWDGNWLVPISDEPYFTFSSVGAAGTASVSIGSTFDDVDSGEWRTFPASEGCLWGGANCAGAPAPVGIGFSIGAWESDTGLKENTWDKTRDAFLAVGPILSPTDPIPWAQRSQPVLEKVWRETAVFGPWPDDDWMGTVTLGFAPDTLRAMVTNVGNVFHWPVTLTDGDADYVVWVQIKRTA